jgi:hypothetical protein
MQALACLLAICILGAVNGALRRYVFHHPDQQDHELAYMATRWLLTVAIIWLAVVVTLRLADRYLPGESILDHDMWLEFNETTTEFLLPPLPSWSEKQ